MYLITAMLCIGEAAATSCNYADSQEEKESEQNSGPQRNDYTTHSLRMEILIAMTAAMLLTIMIDRTVRRLIRFSCGSCLCVLRQRSVFGVRVVWALRAHVNLFVYLFLGI